MPTAPRASWSRSSCLSRRPIPGSRWRRRSTGSPPQPASASRALIAWDDLSGEDVTGHAEFQRRLGRTNCSSLQVVRYTSDERLWEIVRQMEMLGIRLSNPHSYILEDKGARVPSADLQLAFKHEADPHGLLNPGKMSRWTAA